MAIEPTPVADIRVPEEVSRLTDLAYNLWWSWTPRARLLFAAVSKQLWGVYRNPVQLLINIEPHAWKGIIDDGGAFMSNYRRVIRDFERYTDPEADTWFKRNYPDYKGGPVAYLSPEFGIHESLGIYCGGLGVLSGDHMKAASDMGLPFIGIGLLYKSGYFRQAIDPDGRQHHIYTDFDFYRLPLRPLHDTAGRDLVVAVDFPGRQVHARVWRLQVGRVHLYLLDTDIPDNDAADRPITSQLYVRGREMRLYQEVLLGVGGVRALRALKIEPAVWHMNEGHSAFLIIERMREMLKNGRSQKEATEAIHASTVFTTHTPVPAGNESFDVPLVEKFLKPYADSMGMELPKLLDLGKSYPEGGSQPFNLTALAIRFSRCSNGVSKLHGEVANQMWRHLYPPEVAKDSPIKYVTNGVHLPTWLGHDVRTLIEEKFGSDWQDRMCEKGYWDGLRKVSDRDVWEAHQNQKERLIRLVRHRLVAQLARHGKSPEEIREVDHMLDPNILTIGFARRFATYKRAGLIFQDYNRLRNIIANAEHPVQIIFSGKAHPADVPGQELVRHIVNIAFYSELKGRIFFVEDYGIRIARHLVQGVDVWLNTPRRPREASGTSGMKAAMNGAANLSVADGWWPEGHNGKNGWVIGESRHYDNEEMQDYEDAASFYDILERQIIPLYYSERDKGMPAKWVELMKECMISILPAFNAVRMLEEYARASYWPTSAPKAPTC
ncbi:MAG: alpha-glucan family phosphorylase [Kiritimatiellae bacterium]|nr:alpha-glucan family phosphorylase [Kiritimatiellia bacterium]